MKLAILLLTVQVLVLSMANESGESKGLCGPASTWDAVCRFKRATCRERKNRKVCFCKCGGRPPFRCRRCLDASIDIREQRVSKKRTKKVKPLPHQPFKEDPKGCGNPICVVLDQKPRRFPSLCQFRKWLLDTSRDYQINYIQKGDCYEIIHGNGKKYKKQPWTEPLPDDAKNDICEGCRNDTNCRKKITFNIDLQSLLEGQSSANFAALKGDPTLYRLGVAPVVFDNICEAMKYFSKRENLNINTQVIGFGHKKKHDLLPLQDVCTDHNEETRKEGDSWICEDGCNTCSCLGGGLITSTRLACPPTVHIDPK